MTAQFPLIVNVDAWERHDMESSNNDGKRRCFHFLVKDKLKHIKRLERGESVKVIARELGISPGTVRRWRTHRAELAKVDDIEHRKRVRLGANPRLDEAVYLWFEKRRAEGVTVSGSALKGKAAEINEKIGGDTKFNASDGWLTRWRYRYGIRRGITENDKLPISFEDRFSEMLENEMGLTSNQVFNVATTVLNWKVMPMNTVNGGRGGWVNNPDRITIMTCSNVDSTLKLRLLVVGKSAQPRGLKNVQRLTIPVCYAHQENAEINSQIFGDWFSNEFVPGVSRYLIEKKMPLKALLLLDETDPITPDLGIGGIKTMLVPPDKKLFFTSRKQEITRDLKRRYRQGLLESASDAQDKGHDPFQHIKMLGMKDIIFRLDNAWAEVSQKTILESWNDLLPPVVPIESDPLAIENEPEVNDVLNLLRKIMGNEEITDKEVDVWINDSETVPRATNAGTIEALKSEENEADNAMASVEEKDVITSTEAVEALDSVIHFFERHGRLSVVELAALRKAREHALSMKTKEHEP